MRSSCANCTSSCVTWTRPRPKAHLGPNKRRCHQRLFLCVPLRLSLKNLQICHNGFKLSRLSMTSGRQRDFLWRGLTLDRLVGLELKQPLLKDKPSKETLSWSVGTPIAIKKRAQCTLRRSCPFHRFRRPHDLRPPPAPQAPRSSTSPVTTTSLVASSWHPSKASTLT